MDEDLSFDSPSIFFSFCILPVQTHFGSVLCFVYIYTLFSEICNSPSVKTLSLWGSLGKYPVRESGKLYEITIALFITVLKYIIANSQEQIKFGI